MAVLGVVTMGRSVLAVLSVVVLALLIWVALPPAYLDDSRRSDRPDGSRGDGREEAASGDDSGRDETAVADGPHDLRGTVLHGGVPSPARVEIFRLEGLTGWPIDPPRPCATMRTDEWGRFEVAGLREGPHRLCAIVEDGASASVFQEVPGEGRWRFLVIDVPVGGLRLSGRAVHADGTPFRGEVLGQPVSDRGHGRVQLPPVRPDANGRFVLQCLSPGPVRLIARAQGRFEVIGPAWRVPARTEVVFVVDEGLTRIAGRVVADEDDAPVAGAVIWVSDETGEEDRLGRRTHLRNREVSDADGRFETYRELLPAGIDAEGFASASARRPEDGEALIVRLSKKKKNGKRRPRWGTLRGRVLDASGAAIEGAVVRCGGGTATSGPDGAFEIRVARKCHVYVLGGGWVSPELHTHRGLALDGLLTGAGRGETTEKDLVAIPATRLRVRIIDGPVESTGGATVTWGWDWRPPRDRPAWGYVQRVSEGAAPPDAHGALLVADLIPGMPYRMKLRGRSGMILATAIVTGKPGEEVAVEIIHPPLRHAEVQVLFSDTGEPVAGARLYVHGAWAERTDGSGRATIGQLPPGKATVEVNHPDLIARSGPHVLVEDGPTVLRVERGHVVAGVVLGSDGRPVPCASVYLECYGGRGGSIDAQAYTAADGSFRFGRIPGNAGEVHLQAESEDGGEAYVVEMEGTLDRENHVLQLALWQPEPRPHYDIEVVDASGRPVNRATILSFGDGPGRAWLWKNGRFRLTAAQRPDTVFLTVFNARSEDGALAPVVVGPLAGTSGPVRISLSPAKAMAGKVLDAKGEPVAGAEIAARVVWSRKDIARNPPRNPHAETTTAADGSFHLDGLAAEAYELTLKVPTPYALPNPVVVRGGETDVRIVLRRAADVTILVLGGDGKPASGASIRVKRHANTFRGKTDERGTVRPARLDPGVTYWLWVSLQDHLDQDVFEWTPADRTFRMVRTHPIFGVVRDADGKARARIRILYRPSGRDEWSSALSGADGTFKLSFVPEEGPVEIRVVPRGRPDDDPDLPVVVIASGSLDVVLRMP
jgi:hypothetical protein